MKKILDRIFLWGAFLFVLGLAPLANGGPPSDNIVEDSMATQASSPSASQLIPSSMPSQAKWSGVPNQCEPFEVYWSRKKGKYVYKRIRGQRTDKDRDRFKKIIRLVAHEMGANPTLLLIWAARESNYNPHASHLYRADRNASFRSWKERTPDQLEEQRLLAIMSDVGVSSPKYWIARAELSKITTYKNNPFYNSTIAIPRHLRNGKDQIETRSAWAHGQGPFGANPGLWISVWDEEAPPWILCSYEGVPSIIMQIWSSRKAQKKCISQGLDGGYVDVNRRISSGHCKKPRPESDANFKRRAKGYRLRLENSKGETIRARLGKKWPQESTDRKAVLDYMMDKVAKCDRLDWAKDCGNAPDDTSRRRISPDDAATGSTQ